MMIWLMRHPHAHLDMLGHIPAFLSEDDPRPAREQLDDNYQHGGGWRPLPGFTMLPNGDLEYPDDPVFPLLAETQLRDETVRIYRHAFVAVVQKDGSFEVCLMD